MTNGMSDAKIRKFMTLAGQEISRSFETGSPEQRRLGARLLLSEVLEYIVYGLGITPVFNGTEITHPDNLSYTPKNAPDKVQMTDGLADVAYTMYWNSCAFGIPLEEAFELVCDNNLAKFVKVDPSHYTPGPVERESWHLHREINWPSDVVQVEIVKVGDELYGVGKDSSGKVRKPSTFKGVQLQHLV